MNEVKLSNLLNLYYLMDTGKRHNEVNLCLKKEYNDFFNTYEPNYHYSQFMLKPFEVKDYSKSHVQCLSFIEKLSLKYTNQEKIKKLDFSNVRNIIALLNTFILREEELKDEVFNVTKEEYDELRKMVVTAIQIDKERFSFMMHRETVLKYIAEENHKTFIDLTRKVNGKRLTGSTTQSFCSLRDDFDIADEEFLNK